MWIVVEPIIWLCRFGTIFLVLLAIYPYTLYPFLLRVLVTFFPRRWRVQTITPRVTVIIAAHNEEKCLQAKLENTLALEYPRDLFEIIVASDCSTDKTDEIALSYGSRVRLVRLPERGGKQRALNAAVKESSGEIIVFTDASVNLGPLVLRRLTRNFADPSVGAVSSVIKITSQIGTDGLASADIADERDAEGVYLDFDIKTREMESLLYSAVGCCGSCYAIRRICFAPFADAVCNDFASALDAVDRGYRAVVDTHAIGYMLPAKDIAQEFHRKSRTIAGGLMTLWSRPRQPSFGRYPLFWWCLASHKAARWLGPQALTLALVFAAIGALYGGPLLTLMLATSVIPVALGGVGLLAPALRSRSFILRFCSFSLVAIGASYDGWGKFLRGKVDAAWNPTDRGHEFAQDDSAQEPVPTLAVAPYHDPVLLSK